MFEKFPSLKKCFYTGVGFFAGAGWGTLTGAAVGAGSSALGALLLKNHELKEIVRLSAIGTSIAKGCFDALLFILNNKEKFNTVSAITLTLLIEVSVGDTMGYFIDHKKTTFFQNISANLMGLVILAIPFAYVLAQLPFNIIVANALERNSFITTDSTHNNTSSENSSLLNNKKLLAI